MTSVLRAAAPIALLTDFGQSDWYVAALKAVLLSQAPYAALVDITHEVPPGDVARAAFVLGRVHESFPLGSVFVAVVDPGVDTARRPIAVAAGGRLYTGPDNGILACALDLVGAEAREISDAALFAGASPTFHGRDVFAPVAARLATGGAKAFAAVGPVIDFPVRPLSPAPRAAAGDLATRVAHVDHFGNAITQLDSRAFGVWLAGRDPAEIVFKAHGAGGTLVTVIPGLARTYGDGQDPIALIGSSGLIELAVPGGHAALQLGLAPGDVIEIHYGTETES